MANDYLNRYIWLVDMVSLHGPISYKSLDARWRNSGLNDGSPLPRRTLYNHIDSIRNLFGIDIQNQWGKGFVIDDNGKGTHVDWMMSCLNVNGMLTEYKNLSSRILLEPPPQGQNFLGIIMEAMEASNSLKLCYKKFTSVRAESYLVDPYCVKLFKGRWYMLAYNHERGGRRIYAMDRMQDISITEQSFILPADFDAEEVFHDCYGVFPSQNSGKKKRPENVVLRAYKQTSNYLLTRPLHHSQQAKDLGDGVWEFSYYIADTYDFRQELLSYGSCIEVISPKSLRDEMAKDIAAMNELYNK